MRRQFAQVGEHLRNGEVFYLAALLSISIFASAAPNAADLTSIEVHDGTKDHWKVSGKDLVTESLQNLDDRSRFKELLTSWMNVHEIPSDSRRALREALGYLAQIDRPSASEEQRLQAEVGLQETIAAFNNAFYAEIPRRVWIGAAPIKALDLLSFPIMTDHNAVAAANVNSADGDPEASGWWAPIATSSLNLYGGFGRVAPLDLARSMCSYAGKKTSSGTHGAVKILCGGTKYKIKFGNETHVEPFNTRVAWALGYPTRAVDYVPRVYVGYDRSIITDYNDAGAPPIDLISLLGFKFATLARQKFLNPFDDAIAGAFLKDGSYIVSADLQVRLMKGKWDDLKFDEAFEAQIKTLVLRESNVEAPLKSIDEEDLGSWSWNDLDHSSRREMRGFAVFSAFVNNFDIKTDNNALSVETASNGSRSLRYVVKDLGAGLGDASSLVAAKIGDVNLFPWSLVTASDDGSYQFNGYRIVLPNSTFASITPDDARWMIRKLSILREDQLTAALVASGFTSAELKLYVEKLVSRRRDLIKFFGLAGEFPDLYARKPDKHLNYDPITDGVVTARVSGRVIPAIIGAGKVVDGRLL